MLLSKKVSKQIQNYYFCQQRNCRHISSQDLAAMSKDNKFEHKSLFGPKYGGMIMVGWPKHGVYIDRKEMLCSLCRIFEREEEKKFTMLKNEVNFKVLKAV